MISGAAAQHDRSEDPERFPQPDTLGASSNLPQVVRVAHDRSVPQQPVRDTQRGVPNVVQSSILELVAQLHGEDQTIDVRTIADALGAGHELQSIERRRSWQSDQVAELQVTVHFRVRS